jgi:peptidoglycan/LPS O-acetylase OafA/YrhL
MKNSSDRLLELDVLRGLAAFSVLCFHYTTKFTDFFSPPTPTLFKFPFGFYGVGLFFMISGFVILMTLEKTERPLDFIVSRFSRLYPCYWAAIITTFTVVNVFHLPGRESSLPQAIINMSMLQDWFGIKEVDGAYWTLTIELSFYLLMFLFFVTKKLKHIEFFSLLWLVFMVYNDRFLWQMHVRIPECIQVTRLLHYGHLFIAGIFFYNLKTKGNAWFRHVGLALCLVVQYLLRTDAVSTVVVAMFFLIFYLFLLRKLSWIVNRPMVFLGSISYSGYLTHQYIGYVIIRYLYSIHANTFLTFFLPTLCSLLIATFITYAIEKPAMLYIRQKYKIWKQKTCLKFCF